MSGSGFTLFDTPLGRCAIAWGERGIVGLQLPEARESSTRSRIRQRFPSAVETPPPREVKRAIDAVAALLGGRKADLSKVTLDMDAVSPFHRRVYETARDIPAGQTLSYGEVAARLGSPKSARAVGQALGRNPFPIVVPCHRVLAAGGKAGGFTAEGGVHTKMRMLEMEQPKTAGAKKPSSRAGRTTAGAKSGSGTATPAKAKPSAATEKPTGAKNPPPAGKSKTAGDSSALGFDPKAARRHLRRADPALAGLLDEFPFTLQLNQTQSVFSALAEAIVYQQLTGKAAATIYGRVCALFPRATNGFTPKHILATTEENLRSAGLSRAKAAALRDLAHKTATRELPTLEEVHAMADDDIVERLTAVRGIGRWTVEMLLMFRLGRGDVLPADDYGVRKGFALTYGRPELPSRKELEQHGETWRPYRSVASWYMWRAVDLAKR
jgi:methylated-DNA-[protein]-cysteine S-methyltransferase